MVWRFYGWATISNLVNSLGQAWHSYRLAQRTRFGLERFCLITVAWRVAIYQHASVPVTGSRLIDLVSDAEFRRISVGTEPDGLRWITTANQPEASARLTRALHRGKTDSLTVLRA